jgi:hypothetical protein
MLVVGSDVGTCNSGSTWLLTPLREGKDAQSASVLNSTQIGNDGTHLIPTAVKVLLRKGASRCCLVVSNSSDDTDIDDCLGTFRFLKLHLIPEDEMNSALGYAGAEQQAICKT